MKGFSLYDSSIEKTLMKKNPAITQPKEKPL
ncbi:hypothetical protein IGI66_002343 [Enterococcus sp. AZ048]